MHDVQHRINRTEVFSAISLSFIHDSAYSSSLCLSSFFYREIEKYGLVNLMLPCWLVQSFKIFNEAKLINEIWKYAYNSYFMEFLCFQLHIYLEVGLIFLLLAATSSCKHSCSAFSEKHTLRNTLPLRLCEVLQEKFNFVPRLSVLHRRLIGEGSHRHPSSSIGYKNDPESLPELPSHLCEAIIVERLPSGVFADPFELQHLTQRGVFADASAFGDTDLELPSVRANRSVVEVHMDIGHNTVSGKKNGLEINIELPLHARYPPLGDHDYSRVEFGLPDLFVRCIVEGNSYNQSCIFESTDNSAKSMAAAIVWEVPCGIVEHTRVVSVLTFISAIVSAFLISLACIYYSDPTGRSGSKHS